MVKESLGEGGGWKNGHNEGEFWAKKADSKNKAPWWEWDYIEPCALVGPATHPSVVKSDAQTQTGCFVCKTNNHNGDPTVDMYCMELQLINPSRTITIHTRKWIYREYWVDVFREIYRMIYL